MTRENDVTGLSRDLTALRMSQYDELIYHSGRLVPVMLALSRSQRGTLQPERMLETMATLANSNVLPCASDLKAILDMLGMDTDQFQEEHESNRLESARFGRMQNNVLLRFLNASGSYGNAYLIAGRETAGLMNSQIKNPVGYDKFQISDLVAPSFGAKKLRYNGIRTLMKTYDMNVDFYPRDMGRVVYEMVEHDVPYMETSCRFDLERTILNLARSMNEAGGFYGVADTLADIRTSQQPYFTRGK